jgi:hypothetical protein
MPLKIRQSSFVESFNPLCPTEDHAYKLPKSQGVLTFIPFGIGMREPYGSLGNLSQLGA